jgi:hypothetical protein
VIPPPVAVTARVYPPGVTEASAFTVAVAFVPEGVVWEFAAQTAEIPALLGEGEKVQVTGELKPPVGTICARKDDWKPAGTVTVPGRLRVNPDVGCGSHV